MDHNRPLQIAIDGPVGSGKGTLAVALAKELKAIHIYTGGMYRALALACIRKNINILDEKEVLQILMESKIDLKITDDSPLTKVFLNDEDVTQEIFFPAISNKTPIVAAYKSIREEMVKRQKEIAQGVRGVIEGRDIATHVIPEADLKVYLTASVDERARRRYNQLKEKSVNLTFEEVKNDVIGRDKADSEREHAPLGQSVDSFVIDTTNDSIDDTVDKVKEELIRRELI